MRQVLRIICILVLAPTLLSALSCGSGGETGETQSGSDTGSSLVTDTAGDARILPDVEVKDWGGREFRVLGTYNSTYPQFTNFEFVAEDITGAPINDSVYNRNGAVSDKYGIKVAQTLEIDPGATLKTLSASGDVEYDLIAFKISIIPGLADGGYLYDLNSVENLDFSKPWWNTFVNEAAEINGRLYFTTGDLLLMDKHRTYMMMCNNNAVEDLGLTGLYSIVDEGEWTYEKMYEYMTAFATDVDGGGMNERTDKFGFALGNYDAFAAVVYGFGNKLYKKDGGDFALDCYNEHLINSIDMAVTLCCDTGLSINAGYTKAWGLERDAFCEGRALFMATFPSIFESVSNQAAFRYGVIPFPKYDAEQEKYLSIPDPLHSQVFAIPSGIRDTDFASYALEVLSAEATYTSYPAYFETYCQYQKSYDEESARMLRLVFDNIVYDPVMLYNIGGLGKIFSSGIPEAKRNIYTTSYKSLELVAKRQLEVLLKAFSKVE